LTAANGDSYGRDVSDKKISTTVYLTPAQHAQLKVLHDRTKVPMAELIRQGIDMVLAKHADKLPGQLKLVE
jgi:hypothetical protein